MKIAAILQYLRASGLAFRFSGEETAETDGFSSLGRYRPGTFTWLKSAKNIPDGMDMSAVRLAFVQQGEDCAAQNVIETAASKRAFFSSIEHFYAAPETAAPVGQGTYLAETVTCGEQVRLGHNCTLDGEIQIGAGTRIWNNVVLVGRVRIGENCEIKSGAVIGQDGYAYTENAAQEKTMVRHFGGVSIGRDVLIGENVCISRGTIDDTEIGDGCKIDALVHIAHNCRLGRGTAIAVPTSLSGSVTTGENCYIAGDIVRNQIHLGQNAFIGLGAVVVKDVPDGVTVVGNPAKPFTKGK